MTQCTMVLCSSTITLWYMLQLETRLLFETWLVLEQCSQTPGLY